MQLFSSLTLKLMAIIFMVMDHLYTFLGSSGLGIPIWFSYLGKLAAPIFFYLIVEGFFHTRSRPNYIERIFLMGALMFVLDRFLLHIPNNIFLSLGCGLVMLVGIEHAQHHEKPVSKRLMGVALAVFFALLGLMTEASLYGVGMVLIFYFFRQKKALMALVYIVFSLQALSVFIGPNFIEAIFQWDWQWMMVFAIVPILMYNGQRGRSNSVIKWLFYWFYPLHLTILVMLAKVLS